jgi:hypothetical protein
MVSSAMTSFIICAVIRCPTDWLWWVLPVLQYVDETRKGGGQRDSVRHRGLLGSRNWPAVTVALPARD